jgi:hypothetical protein
MSPTELAVAMTAAYLEDHCQDLDTDVLLGLWSAVDAGDLVSLATASRLLPRSTAGWVKLRQVEAFWKKCRDFSSATRCTENCLKSFLQSEEECRIANQRLDAFASDPSSVDPEISTWVRRMERSIDRLLGDFRPFLDDLPRLLRVTAGATLGRSRKRALPFLKVSGRLTIPSSRARNYWDAIHAYWHGDGFHGPQALEAVREECKGKHIQSFIPCASYKVESCNRISLVEKNWSTYRTTAAESEGAMPFQLAFDQYGKERLRNVGVDLKHGQKHNAAAALRASADWDVVDTDATIDMERASDCTAFNAVALLFPYKWFEFLNTFRSKRYTGQFGDGQYEKFSSMGNGSTFVIETIIFWAAAVAVGANQPLIYGDDVIIPSHCVADFERLVNFLGFTMNREKSFTEGPFRESCGGDYFAGVRVTPFYFRRQPSSKREWAHLVNGLLSLSYPCSQMEALATSLLVEQQLRVVPYNSDDSSGVFISPTTAYAQKLIRETAKNGGQTTGIRGFMAYTTLPHIRRTRGWRNAFLWHVAGSSVDPEAAVQQSKYDPPGLDPVLEEEGSEITSTVVGSRQSVQWRIFVASSPCPFHVYSSEEAVLAAHSAVMKAVKRARRDKRRNAVRKNG